MKVLYFIALLSCFVLFSLLLLRNPFSERTLIPNLEPFPDTLHYIVPALSLARGHAFLFIREGRGILPIVGPWYGLVLTPLFMVYNDPRMFYFNNIILSFGSAFLFFRILRKTVESPWARVLGLFLYVTNFFITWYPSLAMAENLGLFVVLLAWNLLMDPITKWRLVLIGAIPILLYGTKYAYLPLTVVWVICVGIKIFLSKERKTSHIFGTFAKVFFWMTLWSVAFLFLEKKLSSSNILDMIMPIIQKSSGNSVQSGAIKATTFFSLKYARENFQWYIEGLFGAGKRFLWDYTPFVARWITQLGFLGLFLRFFSKKNRVLAFGVTLFILGQLLFLSTFETADMRYVYFTIPAILLGATWTVDICISIFFKNKPVLYTFIFVGILVLLSFIPNFSRMRRQIAVNLKYTETPWIYLTVKNMNTYFATLPQKNDKPLLITVIPPYFVDFYSHGDYEVLPLAQDQEFRNNKVEAWGPHDYTDLITLYKNFLNDGREIYITNYGSGNASSYQKAYDEVQSSFKLTPVYSGCSGVCNIYKVEKL